MPIVTTRVRSTRGYSIRRRTARAATQQSYSNGSVHCTGWNAGPACLNGMSSCASRPSARFVTTFRGQFRRSLGGSCNRYCCCPR